MNNYTTAKAPLRPSESVDILTQQILGNIKRDGNGQFYVVKPAVNICVSSAEIYVKDLRL